MMELAQTARIGAQMAMDVASAAAGGIALSRLWLGDDAPAAILESLRRWLAALSALFFVAVIVEFLALASIMSDATTVSALRSALPDVASTEAGGVLARTAGAAALLVAIALFSGVLRKGWSTVAVLAIAFVGLLLRTPLGHASADGAWSLREIVQFVHLTSVAVWGGGVMVAGLVVMPSLTVGQPEQTVRFGGRLSRSVTIAVVCVALSGIYNSWRGLGGSLAPLPRTQWGQLLLSKVVVVCIALALGARMRLLLGRLNNVQATSASTVNLRKWLRLEALAMLAIFILSAWLANAAPAGMDVSRCGRWSLQPTLYEGTVSHICG